MLSYLDRVFQLARISHANSSRDAARPVLTRRTQVFAQGCVNTLPKGKSSATQSARAAASRSRRLHEKCGLAVSALLALSLGNSVMAAEPGDPDDPLATVALPDDIVAEKGLEFAAIESDGKSKQVLRYDLIRLRGSEKSQHASPLLLFIHGGGWRGGVRESWYRRLFFDACEPLIRNGMVVATIDYRLAGKGGATTLDSVVDCQQALIYFRQNAERLNLDLDRLAIMGGSAGGHLALMTALAPAVGESEGKTLPQAKICVPYYPLCHFGGSELHPKIMAGASYGSPGKFTPMLGGPAEEKRELAEFLSPITHLRRSMPTVLLLHGDADPVLPVASARAFAEKAKEIGAPVVYVEVAGGNHGFRTADDPDVRGITERVGDILRVTLEIGYHRTASAKDDRAASGLAINVNNASITVVSGKTRVDGHETRSKRIAMSGPGEETREPAMLAILCHPDNHDFPQRMRVWPPKTHKGAIFFNYVPIQENAWSIESGQTSVMRYRLVVADGKPQPENLNQRWQRYADESAGEKVE